MEDIQMQCIAFAAPMLPGKTETDRAAMQACSHGERQEAFESSRQRHGITREAVWVQQTPGGDLAVVYLEADDLKAALAGLGSSQEPFDQWFRGVVREVHGIDLAESFPPPDQLLDHRGASTAGDASKPQGAVA